MNKMRRSTITILGIILAILLFTDLARGQEIITLDQAISVSLENNIKLKRARNDALIAKYNKFQALITITFWERFLIIMPQGRFQLRQILQHQGSI